MYNCLHVFRVWGTFQLLQWKDDPMLALLINMFVLMELLHHQLSLVSVFLLSPQRRQGTTTTKRAWGVLTSASGNLVTLSRGTQLGLAR
jgi:hypothetical protein